MSTFSFAEEERLKQQAAESPARRAAREWLSKQGQRSLYAEFGGMTQPEFEQLRSLLGYPAFGLLYSLLQHERMEYLVQLANSPLRSAEHIADAAVLQGKIRNLDQIREMLLDIADPHAQQNEELTDASSS